jgi:hypothetical protein
MGAGEGGSSSSIHRRLVRNAMVRLFLESNGAGRRSGMYVWYGMYLSRVGHVPASRLVRVS